MDQDLKDYLDHQFAQFAEFRQETTQRFDAVDQRFDAVDQRFDGVDRRLDSTDQRLDRMDQRFDGVDQRLDRIDQRFDGVDQRLDRMDQRFDGVDQRADKLHDGIHKNGMLIEQLTATMQTVAEGVVANRELIHQLIGETRRHHHEFESLMGGAHGALELRVTDHDDELKKLDRRVDALEAA